MPDPTPVTTPATSPEESQLSTFQYCSTGEGTVDKFLPGLPTIPQINSGKEFEDTTDVGQKKRSYTRKALPEDQDFELVLRSMPGVTDQKTFIDMVKAETPISIKITRADGEVQDAVFLPQDHFSGESGKDSGKQMFGCIGKLQDVDFITVSGS